MNSAAAWSRHRRCTVAVFALHAVPDHAKWETLLYTADAFDVDVN